ncbi:hypothetical protein [Owenweeksia hongkongensis]|uniref:hypothetical protein n=1 Tax=Owenweeksia hongkongensis TaxID=253245 RepID=UPI003A932D6B
MMRSAFSWILWALALFCSGLLVSMSLPYLNTKIYDFPETKPFSGNEWYNPYQDVDFGQLALKANFHGHTHKWGGITSGVDSEEELIEAYQKRDYAVIGISNYHAFSDASKSDEGLNFPIYEHGYNILKSHRMVFGGDEVTFFDYPLFQFASQKQQLIDLTGKNSKAVAINHPRIRHGHTSGDLEKLVGYDFVEVLNNGGVSVEEWDAALSVGRLSWLLSNDDTHDVSDSDFTFRKWTMIFGDGESQDEVLGAMKAGKMYGVNSVEAGCNNQLEFCKIENDTLKVTFTNKQVSLVLVGQNGEELDVVYSTNSAKFKMPQDQPYIRIFGFNPECHTLLNPIVRWDGTNLALSSSLTAEVNWFQTILAKLLVFIIIIAEVFLMVKTNKWLKPKANQ